MNRKDKIKIHREHVAHLLGYKCFLCHKKFGKNFHFHHVEHRKGEKKLSDFKEHSSNQKNWEDYQEYVLPIIEKFSDKFELLCREHHRLIEIPNSLKSPKFERYVDLLLRTRAGTKQ